MLEITVHFTETSGADTSGPMYAQALAAAPLLAGKSAVLAAETGSGKTLAYLAPLISALLSQRDGPQCGADEASGRSWHALHAAHPPLRPQASLSTPHCVCMRGCCVTL